MLGHQCKIQVINRKFVTLCICENIKVHTRGNYIRIWFEKYSNFLKEPLSVVVPGFPFGARTTII